MPDVRKQNVVIRGAGSGALAWLLAGSWVCWTLAGGAASAPAKASEPPAAEQYTTETLRGKLVWQAEALRRRFRIDSDADAAETSVALETGDGRVVPLVKDFRTRGFWLDERLRGRDVEMVVRRYDKMPAVQMVRWYALRNGRKYDVDYWCDICAIPMYELKTCDCCQGEIRLREQPADDEGP